MIVQESTFMHEKTNIGWESGLDVDGGIGGGDKCEMDARV